MADDSVEDVELKVTVVADAVALSEAALGLRPDKAERSWIWFYEGAAGGSARPPLLSRGLMLRLRAGRKKTTATLKLRGPEGCLDVPAWTVRTAGWSDTKIEGDWSGVRHLVSASVDAERRTTGDADKAAGTPLGDLLSDRQSELAADWLVPLDGLRPWGPITVTKWEKLPLPGRGKEMVAERWVVDTLRFLEFSTRVPAADAQIVQVQLRDHLASLHVVEEPDAPTKTEAVLTHLTGRGR